MIICCHSEITGQWAEGMLAEKLTVLPPGLQQAALRKRRWLDMQLAIAGKILLTEVLKVFESDFSLVTMAYNSHKRPYLAGSIDFNISHSGNRVICCGTDTGKIGIDIEQVKKINLADYPDYFTKNEWDLINGHTDKISGFYHVWTRKEAVLKAVGTGFHTPLSSVDVVADWVQYDNTGYYIQPLAIAAGYICHIASTTPGDVKPVAIEL